jgi:uncharacterized membrane protein YhaH (DUF805 family)
MAPPDFAESAAPAASAASGKSGRVRFWVLIAWPAFLAACLMEALVFAMVDPGELHWPGYFFREHRQSIYTIAFFAFWFIAMACSAMVLWLAKAAPEINGTLAD